MRGAARRWVEEIGRWPWGALLAAAMASAACESPPESVALDAGHR
jgi:hypothetical protein